MKRLMNSAEAVYHFSQDFFPIPSLTITDATTNEQKYKLKANFWKTSSTLYDAANRELLKCAPKSLLARSLQISPLNTTIETKGLFKHKLVCEFHGRGIEWRLSKQGLNLCIYGLDSLTQDTLIKLTSANFVSSKGNIIIKSQYVWELFAEQAENIEQELLGLILFIKMHWERRSRQGQ